MCACIVAFVPVPGEARMLAQLLGPTSSYWVLLAVGVKLRKLETQAGSAQIAATPSPGRARLGLARVLVVPPVGFTGREKQVLGFWRRKKVL